VFTKCKFFSLIKDLPKHTCDSLLVKVKVTTDGLSWCQAPIWDPQNQILLLRDSCGFVDVGRHSLTRGRMCRLQLLLALTNAFSGPSPVEISHVY
jgi:hypothetical protein